MRELRVSNFLARAEGRQLLYSLNLVIPTLTPLLMCTDGLKLSRPSSEKGTWRIGNRLESGEPDFVPTFERYQRHKARSQDLVDCLFGQ